MAKMQCEKANMFMNTILESLVIFADSASVECHIRTSAFDKLPTIMLPPSSTQIDRDVMCRKAI
jgi:hypothetical protein